MDRIPGVVLLILQHYVFISFTAGGLFSLLTLVRFYYVQSISVESQLEKTRPLSSWNSMSYPVNCLCLVKRLIVYRGIFACMNRGFFVAIIV